MLQKLTKPVNLIFIFSTIIIFILSLVYATDYEMIMVDTNTLPQGVLDLRAAVQSANNMIFYLSIIGFVCFIVLQIVGNGYRKKTFLSNLICGVVLPVIIIIFAVVTIVSIANVPSVQSANIDAITSFRERYHLLPPSNTMNYLSIICSIIYILFMASYVVYTVVKYLQTNKKTSEKVVVEHAN